MTSQLATHIALDEFVDAVFELAYMLQNCRSPVGDLLKLPLAHFTQVSQSSEESHWVINPIETEVERFDVLITHPYARRLVAAIGAIGRKSEPRVEGGFRPRRCRRRGGRNHISLRSGSRPWAYGTYYRSVG